MKKLLLSVSLILPLVILAQSNPSEVVYKDWTMLGESSTQVDVSYRLVKCSSVNQVHLFVFNENPKDQTAKFTIDVINEAGQKFSKSITFALTKAQMYRAECSSNASLNALRLNLPDGFDPEKLTVKISFKQ